jgi:hypothetical protein
MAETPVAAEAAPTAPVAPVAAAPAVAPAAAPVTPAAPAAAAPAAPVAPVAPAAAGPANLLDVVAPAAAPVEPTHAEKVAAAQKLLDDERARSDPNSDKNWNLDSQTLGKGEKPTWLKSDKYKSVAAQAEAYVALESRFGAFKGAPAEGKYEFKPPENMAGATIDMNNPLLKNFTEWAAKNQLNQEGYNTILGTLVQYEATRAPNAQGIVAGIGERAVERIGAISKWAEANLTREEMNSFRSATALDSNFSQNARIAAVFKAMETVISKTSQFKMPKVGDDVVTGTAGEDALRQMQGAKGPDGQRLYDTDPQYRAKVAAAYKAHFDANPVQRDRQGNIRR